MDELLLWTEIVGKNKIYISENLKGVKKAVCQPRGFCYYHLISHMLMYPFENNLNRDENISMFVWFVDML